MKNLRLLNSFLLIVGILFFAACDDDDKDIVDDKPNTDQNNEENNNDNEKDALFEKQIKVVNDVIMPITEIKTENKKILYAITIDAFESILEKYTCEYKEDKIALLESKFNIYRWYWTENQLDSIRSYYTEEGENLSGTFIFNKDFSVKEYNEIDLDENENEIIIKKAYTYNDHGAVSKIGTDEDGTAIRYNENKKIEEIIYLGSRYESRYTINYFEDKISKVEYFEEGEVYRRTEVDYTDGKIELDCYRYGKDFSYKHVYNSDFDLTLYHNEYNSSESKTVHINEYDKGALIGQTEEKYLNINNTHQLKYKLTINITNDNNQDIISWESNVKEFNPENNDLLSEKKYVFTNLKYEDDGEYSYKFEYPNRITLFIAGLENSGGSHLDQFNVLSYDVRNNNSFMTAETYSFESKNVFIPKTYTVYYDKDFKKIKEKVSCSDEFTEWPNAFKSKTVVTYNEDGEETSNESFKNEENVEDTEKYVWVKLN